MDVTEIELHGETHASVTVPGKFPVVARRIGFRCASGEWIERTYTGVPAETVLATVALPDATTHVHGTARDGHVAWLAVTDVLDGLLAVERGESPRFVAPGIAGPRAIKRVRGMESLVLEPDEDPEDFEHVPPTPRNKIVRKVSADYNRSACGRPETIVRTTR